jgi:hypothetical protein
MDPHYERHHETIQVGKKPKSSRKSRSRSVARSTGSRKRSRSAKPVNKVYSTAYQIDRSSRTKQSVKSNRNGSLNQSSKSRRRKGKKDKWQFQDHEVNMWDQSKM